MDAALTQLGALDERPLALQYVLTPAPALFERLSRLLFRASEARLERARLRERGDPGLRSGVAAQELKDALAVQHRRLFFAELRVGGPSYAACRALAGTLRGESAAENQLVERYMRPYGSGPLHARWLQRSVGDPLPSWRRGVLSSPELAALWQLPSPTLRLPGLARSPLPRAPASGSVSRAEGHALLRDEHRPVGIRPEDRAAGLGLIGGQGTGKTAAMCRTVASDARDPGCALIVLDPKSDLADRALSVIPPERTVHYLDFEAPEIGINPLLAPGDPAMVADKVVEAFKDIHEDGDIRTSSDRFLRQAAHAAIGVTCRERFGECPAWLLPPRKTGPENCNERSTGRPSPIPGDASTRSTTRSTAGTSWSGRGGRCATVARPASTGRPSSRSSATALPGCSTSSRRTSAPAATACSPRAGPSFRSPVRRSDGRCRSRRSATRSGRVAHAAQAAARVRGAGRATARRVRRRRGRPRPPRCRS